MDDLKTAVVVPLAQAKAPDKADAGWVAALEARIKQLETVACKDVVTLESKVVAAFKKLGGKL